MTVNRFVEMLKSHPASGKLVTPGADFQHFDAITGVRRFVDGTTKRAVIVVERRRSRMLSVVRTLTREQAGRASFDMRIICPKCNQRMRVRVGLTLKNGMRTIECVRCRHKLTPLVHGPIVAGPHAER